MFRVSGPSWDLIDVWSEQLETIIVESFTRVLSKIVPGAISPPGLVAAAEPLPLPDDLTSEARSLIDSLDEIGDLWGEELDEYVIPFISDMYNESSDIVHAGIEENTNGTVPTLGAEHLDTYLADTRNRSVRLSDDLWRHARDQIVEGVRADESITQLRDRVMAAAGLTQGRASVFARTESSSAANSASLAQAQVSGFRGFKIWLATEDERTRETHRLADGQRVPLTGSFTVGGAELQYCGDIDGPPGEVIQCRCTQVYEFDGESIEETPDEPVEEESDFARGIQTPIVSRERLSGGQIARTDIVEHEDGTRAVVKLAESFGANLTAEHQAIAEVLSSQVARALGVVAPEVIRTGDAEVSMEYMEGNSVVALTDARRSRYASTEQGITLGLFDVITGNMDRNPGNWLTRVNGDLVAIDHGFNWRVSDQYLYDQLNIGTFSEQFTEQVPGSGRDPIYRLTNGGLSSDRLNEVRQIFTQQETLFSEADRSEWYQQSLNRIDEMISYAVEQES